MLYILLTKYQYDRFKGFLKELTLTKEINIIIKDLEAWYTSTGKEEVEWDNYRAWFLTVKHAAYKADKVDLFNKIFDNLEASTKPSVSDTQNIVQAFIERDYATKIADHTLRIAEGEDLPLESVSEIMEDWEKEVGKVDSLESSFVTKDFEAIVAYTIKGGGFDWRLPELNLALGPLRKSDFIVVGSRPDSGKTTFLSAEASIIASQMEDDQIVLWINNEEGGEKVKYRIVQAALGWSNEKMIDNPSVTYQTYKDMMGGMDRVEVLDKQTASVHEVSALMKKHNVGLLVFDQLWKLYGFNKESGSNEVMRQTMLFNQGREWAKEYCPVINVHQADGTAEGEPYPNMSQLHMSKVGIQGEADAIIMIGRSNDPKIARDTRFINIPKNKLSGGPLSDPSYRNGKFELEIQTEIARFKSFL